MTDAPTFADILRIVGRGPKLSRPLDVAEAEDAMQDAFVKAHRHIKIAR